MLHKARARNARPYGHGGVMRSYFFRNIVGARIARPLLEFVQNSGFAHLLYLRQKGVAAIFAAIPFLMTPEIYKPIRRYSTGTSWPSAPIFITSSSTPPTTS